MREIILKANGYKYIQLKREGDVMMLHGINDNGSETWEVVKMCHHKSDHTFPSGKEVCKGDEFIPGTNLWGQNGWTAFDRDHAERIFQAKLDLQPAA